MQAFGKQLGMHPVDHSAKLTVSCQVRESPASIAVIGPFRHSALMQWRGGVGREVMGTGAQKFKAGFRDGTGWGRGNVLGQKKE